MAAQSEVTEITEPTQILVPTDHPTLCNPLEDEQNFVGLLQELAQSLGWALPTYQFAEASPDFICTCTMLVQGQSFSAKEIASQKKKAKHAASRAMLIQLQRWFQYGERVEVDELETSVAVPVEVKERQPAQASASISHPLLSKQLKDGQNFIGFLQQLCQTLKWDLPEYEFSGEPPEFTCSCTVWANQQRFSSKAISSKKKRAKYYATKIVLLALQQHFQGNSAREVGG